MSALPSVTFKIDEATHLAFVRSHYRRSLPRRVGWLVVFAVAMVTVFGILFDAFIPLAIGALGGALLLVAIVLIAYLFAMPRGARSIYRETVAFPEPVTLTADPDGFSIEQPSGYNKVRWEALALWDETPALLALHPNRSIGYVLPKGQIAPETIRYARGLAAESGLPNKGQRRR